MRALFLALALILAGAPASTGYGASYGYDNRGLVTSITQGYATAATGASTQVSRGYDAYGQIDSESVYLDSSVSVVFQTDIVSNSHFEVVRKRGRFPRSHHKVGREGGFTMRKWQRGLCPRTPRIFLRHGNRKRWEAAGEIDRFPL